MPLELEHAYAAEDELREHLGDLERQRIPRDQIVRALNASSRAIDNHTQDQFWADPTPVALQFLAELPDVLPLNPSIATPDAVTITTTEGGSSPVTWLTTDYWLEPLNKASRNLIRTSYIGGTRQFRHYQYQSLVTVTTRWGWLVCPPEVNEACLLKAAGLFHRKDAPFGVATFGDFAAVRITRRDPEVLELLETYVLDPANVGGR